MAYSKYPLTPNSWQYLHGPCHIFSAYTEDKHLLEHYTEDLHLYIRTCIKDNLEFSVDDLTRRWQLPHPGNVVENSSLVLVPTKPSRSQNPPPKKRRTEKANANPESSKQQESRTKSKGKNQKKSMESSSNLAAQEIIEITRFNNIFPPWQTNEKHFPSQQLQSAIPDTDPTTKSASAACYPREATSKPKVKPMAQP